MSLIPERLRTAGCVFAEDEAALLTAEAGSPDELEAMVVRRIAGEPLEQIVGWGGFRGLRMRGGPGGPGGGGGGGARPPPPRSPPGGGGAPPPQPGRRRLRGRHVRRVAGRV